MQILIFWTPLLLIISSIVVLLKKEQAGAELCQSWLKLGWARIKLSLGYKGQAGAELRQAWVMLELI